jgi:hypothetical protein
MPTIAAARQWYPQNDPVHGFDHVLRVYYMAERLAQAESADLVVLGRRGHGGLSEFLLGSVSHQVADHARCPVVIVPPAAGE